MISGLRLWAWVRSQAPKGDSPIVDCENCLNTQDRQTRQGLRCAYEAPVEWGRAWEPPSGKAGFRTNAKLPLVDICPGYTTSLPVVNEVARAHRHWSKGSLGAFAKEPTEALLMGIEVFDSEVNNCQSYEMTPESEGGGRK